MGHPFVFLRAATKVILYQGPDIGPQYPKIAATVLMDYRQIEQFATHNHLPAKNSVERRSSVIDVREHLAKYRCIQLFQWYRPLYITRHSIGERRTSLALAQMASRGRVVDSSVVMIPCAAARGNSTCNVQDLSQAQTTRNT